MRALLAGVLLAMVVAVPVAAKPSVPRNVPRATKPAALPRAADLAQARGAAHIDQRRLRDAVGRRTEPLTAREQTEAEISKLLRGPLRRGTTGLFVADARTGEPLFAFNAENALNPASNVKMISTAAALELLGPEFRYPTRVLGPEPLGGVVRGDVFLFGSYDPTLTSAHFDELAQSIAARGITAIEGNITVGSDPTRDGLFRSIVPIEVTAGEPGKPPTATTPPGFEHVTLNVTATTATKPNRPRLSYTAETMLVGGLPRVTITIAGMIGKGRTTGYRLVTREKTAAAVYTLRAALRAHGIQVSGDMKIAELNNFIGDAVGNGALPVELARHESRSLAEIVTRINKWSVNWLADRVIMTAAALTRQQPPTMELALDAMYGWLGRHAGLDKSDLLVDTGSGLSYRTQISPQELVSIVRSAGGFTTEGGGDPTLSRAWLDSLACGDGTLRGRFGVGNRGHIRGKTGTLSTAIALSGVLDLDPERPLAFALITNTDSPLSKARVRKAHDQVVALLTKYITSTGPLAGLPAAVAPATATLPGAAGAPGESISAEDAEETEPETELDREAAGLSGAALETSSPPPP